MTFDKDEEIEETKDIIIGDISEESPDIKESLKDYEEDKDLVLKSINYPIVRFFNNINNGNFNIDVFPEYKDFFFPSEYINKQYYVGFNTLFYEIISFDKNDDKFLVNLRFTDGSMDVVDKVFSTDGNYIIDKDYLKIIDIDKEVMNEDYLIEVEKRLIYKDREVFRVKVVNNTVDSLYINSNIYGFYATDKLNRYYHELLEGSSIYTILPKSEGLYFVEFKARNVDKVYIRIQEEDILIFD